MGGKVFQTERMSKQQYDFVCDKIKDIIGNLGHITKQLTDKTDFGDVDLVVYDVDEDDVLTKLSNYVLDKNGSSLKLQFDDVIFQCDIVLADKEMGNIADVWELHNHGDFYNFVGKMTNAARFKISCDGSIKFRYSKSKSVTTSLSIKQLLKLLDIDKPVTLKYNMSKTEMFEKIVKSKFFKKEYFDLNNLNNRSRKRQLKRPTYMEFLEYIKDIDDSKNEYVNIELRPNQISTDDIVSNQASVMANRIVRDKYNAIEICKHLYKANSIDHIVVNDHHGYHHYRIIRECTKVSEEIRATIFDNLVNYLKNVDTKCIEKLITEDENVTLCKMFFGDVLDFVYLGYGGIYCRKFKTHPVLKAMNGVE